PLSLENRTRFAPCHGRVTRSVLCPRSRRHTRRGRSRLGVAGISSDKICYSALPCASLERPLSVGYPRTITTPLSRPWLQRELRSFLALVEVAARRTA